MYDLLFLASSDFSIFLYSSSYFLENVSSVFTMYSASLFYALGSVDGVEAFVDRRILIFSSETEKNELS